MAGPGDVQGRPRVPANALSLLVAAALLAAAAHAAPAERWAGLERVEVEAIARAGAAEYTKLGAGPVETVASRRYWRGHEAWLVKATFTCAGGNYPAIVLWRARAAFEPRRWHFMCRGARGKRVICREPTVC
jgi:hypothetical protein